MSSWQKFGNFNQDEGYFELTSEPPRKWWNLHCTKIRDDEMYAEVCNIGDGPTWVRDKDGVTVHLVGYDCKYAYIRDDESGTVFCPGGAPAPTEVTDKTCRYYREKTVLQSTCEGLRASQRAFVPQEVAVEAHTIKVENLTDRPRRLSIFFYSMFALHGCDAEGKGIGKENYATVEPSLGGVFATNRNTHVPTDRFKAFLCTLSNFHNGNGYRDHFTRSEFALGTPKILWGWDCDGRPGYGPDCAGVVQVKITVAPGETGRADFLLGQAGSLEEACVIRGSLSPKRLDELCDEAAKVEEKRASGFNLKTGDEHIDALMNTFIKKQLYNYLINKSGFRDNLQVDMALSLADFPAARANVLRALSSQYANGSVPHGFRPLNRLQYSDKPAWILQTVPALLQESGDWSLLDEVVPFFESNESGTVWEHMLRAMRFLAHDTGVHGLCDQHHADWNDGLEATKESGERESVFVTQQLCYGLREVAEIARRRSEDAVEKEARDLYTTFADRLNEVAWDGEWYARTLCADGYVIGSSKNKEGFIFLNPQSWAILSGIATPERAKLCMSKVDELLEADLGYRICYPPFASYDPRVGQMSNSMPGANENGGCYNHAAGFKGVADCLLGRAEEAWRSFRKVCPDNPDNLISQSGAEPFSFVNSYSTVPYIYGQSGYAWRTGTSGWMTQLLVEYILGARRTYEGLLISPCLTKSIPTAQLTRRYRGATYHIELDNTAGRSVGAQSIELDGKVLDGNVLPLLTSGEHVVKVVI